MMDSGYANSLWKEFCAHVDLDEPTFFALLIWLAYLFGYWLPNLLLYIVYHFNLFPSYKIQAIEKWPGKNMHDLFDKFSFKLMIFLKLDRGLVIKVVVVNILSHMIVHPLMAYYLVYIVFEKGQIFSDLPNFWTGFGYIVLYFLWADFWFYWMHRLFHTPMLYRHFHKQHHEFKVTIGVVANYASVSKFISI